MDSEAVLRLHYDSIAKDYVGVNQGVERVLAHLKLAPGASILDIGCGTGNLTKRLAEVGSPGRIVGVDISEGVLALAREQTRALKTVAYEFRQASATCLPFEDEEFDAVVSNMVFHLIPNQEKSYSEALRVLKTSGKMVLQMQGGGDIALEFMQVLQQAWEDVLPGEEPPELTQKITVDTIASHLKDLGVKDFDIKWSHRTRTLPAAAVPKVLAFGRLVLGFWRLGLDEATADRVETALTRRAQEAASKQAGWTATGNVLLVNATKT